MARTLTGIVLEIEVETPSDYSQAKTWEEIEHADDCVIGQAQSALDDYAKGGQS